MLMPDMQWKRHNRLRAGAPVASLKRNQVLSEGASDPTFWPCSRNKRQAAYLQSSWVSAIHLILYACYESNQSGFTNIDLQCGQSKFRFLPIFFIDCCDSFSHIGQIDAEVISTIWSIIRLKKDIRFSLKNEWDLFYHCRLFFVLTVNDYSFNKHFCRIDSPVGTH